MEVDDIFRETLANARQTLLAARGPNGCWEGQLSSSALSTATAIFTLHLLGQPQHRRLIDGGLDWLIRMQNTDGGWGDTILSFSNISTTALCWAALSADKSGAIEGATAKAESWLIREAGSLSPDALTRTIVARYGKDHTFSVPILTMLALAGRLGEPREAWAKIPQLPFELAACPYQWFQWIHLPVVSYALPALIAIGQVRHAKRPTWNPIARLIRALTRERTLRVLQSIQPESGGFLEATPLTSFVSMSLIAAGRSDHPVVREGVAFLEASVLADGSWPIDTNLATWVTSLSVNALHGRESLAADDCATIRGWLLKQQYRVEHPYTHAAPGGWGWTDLTGGVPDADDTPGALLALRHLGVPDETVLDSARAGVTWLLDLQNRDGGIPTFCRGWGALPFDRSSADLTAHTMLAWSAWRDHIGADLAKRIDAAMVRAIDFLIRSQRPDGALAPLWFGNQHADEVANLTYGTSRVIRLASIRNVPSKVEAKWRECLHKAVIWLRDARNADGGWGGRPDTPSSIEETALAIEGLAIAHASARGDDGPSIEHAIQSGAAWLAEHTSRGREFAPAPIGFYFANLWYFEKLYPLIFSVAALSRVNDLTKIADRLMRPPG
jgi:squalene-hopene/tetraprenyl-beta-curcumene cyclase